MSNELCKCGKVGIISCPNDDRCGIVNNTQERAEKYANDQYGVNGQHYSHSGWGSSVHDYIQGATSENEYLQPVIDAAEKVVKMFAHKGEHQTCAICQLAKALEQWKSGKGKEVQPKPIEYMPIHPNDSRKPDCPKQFPMHLLDEAQAQRNHSQSLGRLKERGGLSVREILAIVGKKQWSYYGSLPWSDAIRMLNDIVINNPKQSK